MSLLDRHRHLARGEPSPSDRLLEPLLAPLAWLYGSGVALRSAAYDARILPSRRAPIWTVSVGGLTSGGTGKTPLAAEIASWLRAWGGRPLLVAHGYGARPRFRGARLIGSSGGGEEPEWRSVGEEALLLARLAPGVPVAVARPREAALSAARAEGFDPDALVLDGAFQYRRLAADFSIVSVDGSRQPGQGRLLPRGDLREPWPALSRSNFIVLYRAERCGDPEGWKRFLARAAPEIPVARVANRWGRPYRLCSREPLAWSEAKTMRWGVWLALADPRPFLSELASRGIDPVKVACPRDHAPFTGDAIERFARTPIDALLVSEKDAIKIEAHASRLPAVFVVPAEHEWLEGRSVLEERLRASRLRREAHGPGNGRSGAPAVR